MHTNRSKISKKSDRSTTKVMLQFHRKLGYRYGMFLAHELVVALAHAHVIVVLVGELVREQASKDDELEPRTAESQTDNSSARVWFGRHGE